MPTGWTVDGHYWNRGEWDTIRRWRPCSGEAPGTVASRRKHFPRQQVIGQPHAQLAGEVVIAGARMAQGLHPAHRA
jgi:hypothetical protein